jgi:hypothetical protein
VAGGKMDIISLAASWWLSQIFNVNLNYRYILNDRDNIKGEASGLNIRILLKLQ